MNQTIEATLPCKPIPLTQLSPDYLISALRCARLRASLLVNELDSIGCALRHKLVTPDVAPDWVEEIGAYEFLLPEIGREAAR